MTDATTHIHDAYNGRYCPNCGGDQLQQDQAWTAVDDGSELFRGAICLEGCGATWNEIARPRDVVPKLIGIADLEVDGVAIQPMWVVS